MCVCLGVVAVVVDRSTAKCFSLECLDPRQTGLYVRPVSGKKIAQRGQEGGESRSWSYKPSRFFCPFFTVLYCAALWERQERKRPKRVRRKQIPEKASLCNVASNVVCVCVGFFRVAFWVCD